MAAGVGTGVAGSVLLAAWLRATPPFSWVWPHVARAGDATGATRALLAAERAIQSALGKVASWL